VVICFEYTCRNLEYGFAEPGDKHVPGTFSPKAHKAIVGLVRHIHDEARRRGWPKLYFFPIDEPGSNKTENRYRFAESVLDFIISPRLQTAVTVTADCVRRLGDRFAMDLRLPTTRDKVVQEAKRGHPFWYYENGMFYGHSTLVSRGMAGFEFLRSGAEVGAAWGFASTNAKTYNDYEGCHKDWNVIFPGVDGPTPTIYWELCREGGRCRYVATRSKRSAKPNEGKTEAARRAEECCRRCWPPTPCRIDHPAPSAATVTDRARNPGPAVRYQWACLRRRRGQSTRRTRWARTSSRTRRLKSRPKPTACPAAATRSAIRRTRKSRSGP
jgi:hypothetical protein